MPAESRLHDLPAITAFWQGCSFRLAWISGQVWPVKSAR